MTSNHILECLLLLTLSCRFTLVELSISLGSCDLSCSQEGVVQSAYVGEHPVRAIQGKAGPMGPKGSPGPPGNAGRPGRDCNCSNFDKALAKLTIENRYRDCAAVKRVAVTSGISVISPFANEPGIHVYCDQVTDGGEWIVIQRRVGGTENFYREWNDYVVGFGSKETDFWMGLQIIHKLVSNGSWELRVDLVDHDENRVYAKYRSFTIAGSSDDYRLSVSGYQGTAGDGLAFHNNMQFSTRDRDNDRHSSAHCAQHHEGAWWYTNCHRSNLNGRYGASESSADGVTWYPWYRRHISLKRAEMKIRRIE